MRVARYIAAKTRTSIMKMSEFQWGLICLACNIAAKTKIKINALRSWLIHFACDLQIHTKTPITRKAQVK